MARAASGNRKGRGIGRRILAAAVIGGALWFAVQGGEYGTFDLFSQRARTAILQRDVAAEQHVVDSLVRWKKAIETDPFVQEQVAREEFGMIRGNKELLYRFMAPPDSARR